MMRAVHLGICALSNFLMNIKIFDMETIYVIFLP